MYAEKEYSTVSEQEVTEWVNIGEVNNFPLNDGVCILHEGLQIAVFHFARRKKWYATQNLCPHKHQMILSRGLTGSAGDIPKITCPYHKNSFSLQDGKHLNGSLCRLATYPVREENGQVYLGWKS